MLFINTRPVERRDTLSKRMLASGFDVFELPLLALSALDYSKTLEKLYQQLSDTQLIVVVSPFAVEVGMRYLQKSGISIQDLDHIKWVAVGQTTQKALLAYGIESHIPEVETSEGMLDLDIFKQQELEKVAFWRGEGGRQFMMQHLIDRGVEVLNFLLYQRHCPESSVVDFPVLKSKIEQTHDGIVMCITSEASWNNWLKLCENDLELLQSCHYLVLGQRLYQILQHDKKLKQIYFNFTQVDRLEPDILIAEIAKLPRLL